MGCKGSEVQILSPRSFLEAKIKKDSSSESLLQAHLLKHIPISGALGVNVELATLNQVILSAPLSNNINHKLTVFGGSLHSAATLACWSLLHLNIDSKDLQIVISNSNTDYLKPVTADFRVECQLAYDSNWEWFLRTLEKRNKSRITLQAKIFQNDELCLDYQGSFVAIKTSL